jgi:hypothetical protein
MITLTKNFFCFSYKNKYFLIALIIISIASCEGPAGPAGKDANENCSQCHNSGSAIYSRQIQLSASVHQTGGNFSHNSSDCAPCHTNEGFIERINTGATTSSVPSNPSPIGCRTCHKIHEKFDSSDYELRSISKVKLWLNDKEIDFGTGNLCINCHQPRKVNPMPQIGGGTVNITSKYWGLHHSTQGTIFAGTGGFEISGSKKYQNSEHQSSIKNSCVTCHMAPPYGAMAGGHTMNMTYDYYGTKTLNTSGCISCHSDTKTLLSETAAVENDIDTLLTALGKELVIKGIITNAGSLKTPQTLSPELAGIYLNYSMILEDKSHGIHNYKYVKALLINSLEYIRSN